MRFVSAFILISSILLVEQAAHSESEDAVPPTPVSALLDRQLTQTSELRCHKTVARFVKAWRGYRQVDQIEADVEMHSGYEKYTRIQRKQEEYQRIEDLPGSWSSGELATIIGTTRDAIASSASAQSLAGGISSVEFALPATVHQWYLVVDGSKYWMDIRGTVRLVNNRIAGIEWIGSGLPSKSTIRQVMLAVHFSEIQIGDKMFRVPEWSEYRVDYLDPLAGATVDKSSYTNYRRLGSTVNIHF